MAPAHDESAPAAGRSALGTCSIPQGRPIHGHASTPPDIPPDPQAATPYFLRRAAFAAEVGAEVARRVAGRMIRAGCAVVFPRPRARHGAARSQGHRAA